MPDESNTPSEPAPNEPAIATSQNNDAHGDFLKSQARHAKRCLFEAKLVGVIITVCMICTSTFMAVYGYVSPENRPEQPQLIGGIPAWVVWGLFVPWLVMIAITWWFALFVLKDDEPFVAFPNSEHQQADPPTDRPKHS